MEIQARPDTQREGTFRKAEKSEVNYHKMYTPRWKYSLVAEASDLKKK